MRVRTGSGGPLNAMWSVGLGQGICLVKVLCWVIGSVKIAPGREFGPDSIAYYQTPPQGGLFGNPQWD